MAAKILVSLTARSARFAFFERGALSQLAGYENGEIARELALAPEYVAHFTSGLVQRLTHDGLIPSPEWRNVLKWVQEEGILSE